MMIHDEATEEMKTRNKHSSKQEPKSDFQGVYLS